MTSEKMMKHGGDILVSRKQRGLTNDSWLDLSIGIAPEPCPIPEFPISTWRRLPQTAAMVNLLAAARTAYGVPESGAVVAAPGTQSLIQLLPQLRTGAKVRALGPTYSEHAICWRRQRTARDLRECRDISELWAADVAIRPAGPHLSKNTLRAKACRRARSKIIAHGFAAVFQAVRKI
ncbi:MAG: hypothetical protein ACR2PG_21895 [Hyphomicrobiaceae bacterium]